MDATLQQLINAAPTAALALVFLWLFMSGRIHSHSEFQRVATELEVEKAAHEQTRVAYNLATARSDAGVRAAEIIAASLEGARHAQQALPGVPPPT